MSITQNSSYEIELVQSTKLVFSERFLLINPAFNDALELLFICMKCYYVFGFGNTRPCRLFPKVYTYTRTLLVNGIFRLLDQYFGTPSEALLFLLSRPMLCQSIQITISEVVVRRRTDLSDIILDATSFWCIID